MIFGKRTQRERQHRKNRQRKERRSKFRSEISRQLTHEPLEARQLLAALNVDTLNDVVDPADGLTSLREAIDAANANAESDTINFTLPGTYQMSIAGTGEDANVTGDYDILENMDAGMIAVPTTVTFNNTSGGNVIIDGLQKDRVFHVGPGQISAEFNNITITGGNAQGGRPLGNGGGILNQGGALTVFQSVVEGNNSDGFGGGISHRGNLPATITQSIVDGNFSQLAGGGVANDGGTLSVANSLVTNNITNNTGGGLFQLGGATTVTDTTVGNNTAPQGGGLHAQER